MWMGILESYFILLMKREDYFVYHNMILNKMLRVCYESFFLLYGLLSR